MHWRPLLLIGLPLLTTALAGCEGPTKTGLEAREAANQRMNSFSAQFTYQQAQQDFEVGKFDRALENVELAIEQVPESASYELLRGRIYLETHRLEKAVRSFLDATEKDPELADAHYFAGIVFQRWSDDEEAFNHYSTAFELEPDGIQYLLATAETLIALGELEEARVFVESHSGRFDHNAALRQLLGQIALLEGDAERSAELLSESLMLDPENALLMEELAWAQYNAGHYGQCNDTIDRIRSRGGEPRTGLMHLQARCLTQMDRTTEAHRLYRELSTLSPGDVSVWTEFGTVSWQLGDYRRVAQASVQIIGLAPDRFEGYMLKGLHERHKGRQTEAVELLRQAAARATDTALPHLLLGRTLEEIGRQREALAAYKQAVEIDPASPEARALRDALGRRMGVAAVSP